MVRGGRIRVTGQPRTAAFADTRRRVSRGPAPPITATTTTMANPSSSATSPSPPAHPLQSPISPIHSDAPADRDQRKRAVDKFLARAEIAMVRLTLLSLLRVSSSAAGHPCSPRASLVCQLQGHPQYPPCPPPRPRSPNAPTLTTHRGLQQVSSRETQGHCNPGHSTTRRYAPALPAHGLRNIPRHQNDARALILTLRIAPRPHSGPDAYSPNGAQSQRSTCPGSCQASSLALSASPCRQDFPAPWKRQGLSYRVSGAAAQSSRQRQAETA